MPGSTLNAWPGFERARVAGDHVGVLVRLGADAVPDAVHEVLTEAGVARSPARDAASTSSHGVPTVAARTPASCASTSTA